MTNLEVVLKHLRDNLGFTFSDELNDNSLLYISDDGVTLTKVSDNPSLACSSEGKLANKKLSEILAILEEAGFKIVSACDFKDKYRLVVDYDKP